MTGQWTSPSFVAEATGWIERQLDLRGLSLSGPLQQPHVRWWSTVLRVPTRAGQAWFKAVQPTYLHELPLTLTLAGIDPGLLPTVLAADEARGWLLLGDAGVRLRELDDGRPVIERWEQLLPRYAELQLAAASRAADLLAADVPDLRLATLPTRLAAILDEPELLMLGKPGGLSREEHARLSAGVDDFGGICAQLGTLGIPETVQHDDLHDGNVFVRDGRQVVIDWGDACISHPFHSLVVALRAGAYRHGWAPDGAEIGRLLDAYREPWGRFGRTEVRQAAQLARRTGTVQRALAWAAALRTMPREEWGEDVESVAYGLRLYLQDGPWGTWDDGSF